MSSILAQTAPISIRSTASVSDTFAACDTASFSGIVRDVTVLMHLAHKGFPVLLSNSFDDAPSSIAC